MEQSRAASGLKMDMVHGPLLGKIIKFALPVMGAGVLQQSFNTVDVAVVGRWCGSEALAAVGSNGMIISLIINLFLGISVGANVVISHYIGRRDEKSIRRSVATVTVLTVVSGLLLMVVGLTAARPLLEAIDTPPEVIELASTYLRLYFIGMPFVMAFNFGSAILRSMGDTKRPFYALAVAGVVNIVLDLLFVPAMGMDVDGVAIATVISQGVSATIVVILLMRERDPFRVNVSNARLSRVELFKMLRIGVPAGIQGMVFSLANVFVVGNINLFGAAASAGSAAALTYEYYCYFIISAFTQAAVAFTSASYGAGDIDRCKRIFRICLLLSMVACGLANGFIAWQKHFFVGIFTHDPTVTSFAYTRITTALVFQFLASTYEIAGAQMRGYGYSMTPTFITIIGTCLLRIVWVNTVTADAGDFRLLMAVYPITWTLTGAAMLMAYYFIRRRAFALFSAGRSGF